MLDNSNAYYERLGMASIVHNPNEWVYCGNRDYERLPPHMVARCKDGRPLVRKSSDVDFSGGFRGKHIEFDAKQFSGNSIPLSRFTIHQVDKMCRSERCGNKAGFLVYSTSKCEIYWLTAHEVRKTLDASMGNSRKTPKSFSIEALREMGLVLTGVVEGGFIDYLKKIISL